MCDKRDKAITSVFCRDLYLELTISGLLKNGVFKGRGKLAESFFKQFLSLLTHKVCRLLSSPVLLRKFSF